jgi:hypothetical protein
MAAGSHLARWLVRSWTILALSFCGLVSQESVEVFPVRTQAPDGRWSAAEHGGTDRSDVRASALMTLACIADAERSQHYVKAVGPAIDWLRKLPDKHGRIGFRDDPEWAVDHAIATCCLLERARSQRGDDVLLSASAATNALVTLLEQLNGKARSELVVWSRACLAAIRKARADDSANHWGGFADGALERACALGHTTATTAQERAAALLLAVLDDRGLRTDQLRGVEWPSEDLAEPMTALYLMMAYALATEPGRRTAKEANELWSVAAKRAEAVTVMMRTKGKLRGSWDPKGDFGQRYGRVGTTGAVGLLLLTRWRTCYLALWI